MKLLGMPKASVIDVSVNNENIRFSAKDVKRGLSCFNWLVDKIGTKQRLFGVCSCLVPILS